MLQFLQSTNERFGIENEGIDPAVISKINRNI
jgi:hypothetical protein